MSLLSTEKLTDSGSEEKGSSKKLNQEPLRLKVLPTSSLEITVDPSMKLLEFARDPMQAFQVLALLNKEQRFEEIKKLEQIAWQLGKREEKEVERGKVLNILPSTQIDPTTNTDNRT
eukprot:TRINITY_DN14786_c0_g1_i1.p1 TRINITY_DN14786_c0_g1~~TRINITY_DN14786_c0_g1_i1.p1  ORF type:complete len:117 (+),score=21.31 TRINITY_DN14786_c0_g1_i1:119-469(+)